MGKAVDSPERTDGRAVPGTRPSGAGTGPRHLRQEPVLLGRFRTDLVWLGKKKERKACGRAPEAVEQKVPEELSEDDEPLEHARDALLVGGALRGGGSLAADGAFGTLTADGTSKPVYRSLKSNARTDAKVLKLCAPTVTSGHGPHLWADERVSRHSRREGLRGPHNQRVGEVVEDEEQDDGVPEKVLGEVRRVERFKRLESVSGVGLLDARRRVSRGRNCACAEIKFRMPHAIDARFLHLLDGVETAQPHWPKTEQSE